MGKRGKSEKHLPLWYVKCGEASKLRLCKNVSQSIVVEVRILAEVCTLSYTVLNLLACQCYSTYLRIKAGLKRPIGTERRTRPYEA